MSDESYNGWKNYETWSVALFIDNEQGFYEYVRNIAQNKEIEEYDKVILLREFTEEEVLRIQKQNIYSQQLLNASMNIVDWYEVLRHYEEE